MPKFHDIKPNLAVEDFSFYLFLAISFAVILALLGIAYLMYKLIKNKKPNKIQIAKMKLKKIDFSNSKTAAYEISKYARFLLDNKEKEQIFQDLNQELQIYKYKADEVKFQDKHKALFNAFLELCDV